MLASDASFGTADLCRWFGAERRARLPPEFADSHRLGYGYRLDGVASDLDHTLDHRHLCSSATVCTTVRRNHLPELATLVSLSYVTSTTLLLARTFLQHEAGKPAWQRIASNLKLECPSVDTTALLETVEGKGVVSRQGLGAIFY